MAVNDSAAPNPIQLRLVVQGLQGEHKAEDHPKGTGAAPVAPTGELLGLGDALTGVVHRAPPGDGEEQREAEQVPG